MTLRIGSQSSLIMIFVAAVFLSFAHAEAEKNSADWSLDVELGASIDSFTGLRKHETHDGLDYYVKSSDENLSYAGIPLAGVVYGFTDSALETVQLWTNRQKNTTPDCVDEQETVILYRALAETYDYPVVEATSYSDLMGSLEGFDPYQALEKEYLDCLGYGPYDCELYSYQVRDEEVGRAPGDYDVILNVLIFRQPSGSCQWRIVYQKPREVDPVAIEGMREDVKEGLDALKKAVEKSKKKE